MGYVQHDVFLDSLFQTYVPILALKFASDPVPWWEVDEEGCPRRHDTRWRFCLKATAGSAAFWNGRETFLDWLVHDPMLLLDWYSLDRSRAAVRTASASGEVSLG